MAKLFMWAFLLKKDFQDPMKKMSLIFKEQMQKIFQNALHYYSILKACSELQQITCTVMKSWRWWSFRVLCPFQHYLSHVETKAGSFWKALCNDPVGSINHTGTSPYTTNTYTQKHTDTHTIFMTNMQEAILPRSHTHTHTYRQTHSHTIYTPNIQEAILPRPHT